MSYGVGAVRHLVRHCTTRRTSPTRRAPTPCTTLYDASYAPDASGPDALYDAPTRRTMHFRQHSFPAGGWGQTTTNQIVHNTGLLPIQHKPPSQTCHSWWQVREGGHWVWLVFVLRGTCPPHQFRACYHKTVASGIPQALLQRRVVQFISGPQPPRRGQGFQRRGGGGNPRPQNSEK